MANAVLESVPVTLYYLKSLWILVYQLKSPPVALPFCKTSLIWLVDNG